jgi:hypothetical protein
MSRVTNEEAERYANGADYRLYSLAADLLDARKERDKALVALGWYFTFGCIHGPIPEEMSPVVAAGFTAYKASLAAARAAGKEENDGTLD